MDADIDLMLRHELKLEIMKLRCAIRQHRSNCDDDALYFNLPEIIKPQKVNWWKSWLFLWRFYG
jgi:hypothetical protein